MQATVADLDEELETADEDEERILLQLRLQRMKELQASQSRARFGRVYPISRPDYTREVTEASKEGRQGEDIDAAVRGTGVVCFLYEPGMETCQLVSGYLDTLAERHPATKFVSIIGRQCIPDYPDRNLPTLLIYRNGELRRQIIGLRPEIGLDGMNTKLEAVGALDPRKPGEVAPGAAGRGDDDDSDDGAARARQAPAGDDDDDLDWD